MIKAAAILRKIDNVMNPVTVKELRQAVQSRFITIGVILFLLIQLGVIGLHIMDESDFSLNSSGGTDVFLTLLAFLLGTCVLCIPAYTGVRLGSERSDTNVDLLFITTVSPGRIIRGKMIAAMVLTVLAYSACMPFLVFTYLLRGIDLPTISVMLFIGLLAAMLAIQFAIFMACVAVSRFMRLIVSILTMIIFFMVLSQTMRMCEGITRTGLGATLFSWDFWGPALTTISLVSMLTGLFYVLSVAMLMPPSANRTMPIRIYMTTIWVIGGVICALWSSSSTPDELMYVWAMFSTFMFSACFFLAVSERDNWGPRVRKQIPRNPLGRALAFLLFSGAGGGVCWAVMMLVLTYLIVAAWPASASLYHSYHPYRELWLIMIATASYAYAYSILAVIIRRLILRNRISTMYNGIVALFLVAIGCFLPMLIGFFVYGSKFDRLVDEPGWWMIANPFMVIEEECQERCATYGAFWAALMFICSLPWLFGQISRFRPLQTPPKLPETTDNG